MARGPSGRVSSLQLEEIRPVRAGGLPPLVHGAAWHERDPWFLTREGDDHGISVMPMRRGLRILRGNVLPNDQAVTLADLPAEPCGSGVRGVQRRRFLKLKEHRPQRIRAHPFFTMRDAPTEEEMIPGGAVGWRTHALRRHNDPVTVGVI